MCEFGRHTHFGVEGFVNRTAVGDLEETLESQPERQHLLLAIQGQEDC